MKLILINYSYAYSIVGLILTIIMLASAIAACICWKVWWEKQIERKHASGAINTYSNFHGQKNSMTSLWSDLPVRETFVFIALAIIIYFYANSLYSKFSQIEIGQSNAILTYQYPAKARKISLESITDISIVDLNNGYFCVEIKTLCNEFYFSSKVKRTSVFYVKMESFVDTVQKILRFSG